MKKILLVLLITSTALFAQAPGGVSTEHMSLWLSGDDNITNVVSGELRWGDKIEAASTASGGSDTGFDVYQNRADNLKPSQTELFNFHNTFSFDGANDYFAIESLNYATGTTISDVQAFIVYKTDFADTDFNDNWALIDFDRSDAYNMYINGNGTLSMSYRESTSSTSVNGTTANVSDFAAATAANDDVPHIATYIINNSTSDRSQMRLDGRLDFDSETLGTHITINNSPAEDRFGYIGAGSEAEIEDEDGASSIFYDGEIAEVILFDKGVITPEEILRIESYLALKYGITLSNSGGGTAGDYLYDDGTTVSTIWDADVNADHHKNVAGLIRSTNNSIDKKITKSLTGNIIVATTTDFTSSNADISRASLPADESYLMFGESTETGTQSFDATRNILRKTWLFNEGTTDTGIINIAIPISEFSAGKTVELIITADDGVFESNGDDVIISSIISGGHYYFPVNIADGDLVSFLETKSIYPTPGGVAPDNMSLWLSGDVNTGVLEWNDRVGPATGNVVTGNSGIQPAAGEEPTQTNLMNYNQTFTFDGVDDNFAVTGLGFPNGTSVTDFYTFVVYKSDFNTGGTNDNWAFLDFDRSDVFNAYILGDNGTLGLSYHDGGAIVDLTGTTSSNNDVPHIGTYIFDSALENESILKLDGTVEHESDQSSIPIVTGLTANQDRFGFIGAGSEAESVNGDSSGGPYTGDIAEIIFIYNGAITAADILRVESYLALKYGVTLGIENGKYVDSKGNTLWDNTVYWNNIAGLIKDDVSGSINQAIATSVTGSGLVVSKTNNYTLANNDASRESLDNDGDYLLFGDNGDTGFAVSTVLDGGSTLNIMRRTWLFNKGGTDTGNTNGEYFVAIPIDEFPAGTSVQIIVSDDETFTTSDFRENAVINGDFYEFEVPITDGQYMSFLSTDSQIAGVSVTRFDMLLRADQDLTNDGSNLSWTDGSFNGTNGIQNNSTNIPDSSTNLMNFNPTLTFDGTSDYITLRNKHYDAGDEISDLHTYVVYSTDYNVDDYNADPNPGTNTEGNGNWAFYDFDRSEAFNMYIQPSGVLSFSYRVSSDAIKDINSESLGNDGLPHIAEYIFDNDEMTNASTTKMKFDGNIERDFADTAGNITIGDEDGNVGEEQRYGFIGDGSEANSEGGDNNEVYYDGRISEVILADREEFTAEETLKIESYLAIKYGITLDPDLLSYKNSTGTDIWTNATYWNGIAGILKDDVDSDIDQRVAQSSSALDIIVATDNNFTASNLDGVNRPTELTEGSSLMFGNNGSGTGLTTFDNPDMNEFITARKWLFKEIGTVGTVFIAIPKTFLPEGATDIKPIISTDDVFDGTADRMAPLAITDSGDFWSFSADITDGDRLAFTFLLDNIPAPGGVNDGLSMWIRADKNVTEVIDLISSIGDSGLAESGVFQATNLDKPTLVNDSTFNYNASVNFDGTADHFGINTLRYETSGAINSMYAWVIYKTESTDVDNASFLSFDSTQYFDVSVSGADGNLTFGYTDNTGNTENNVGATKTNDGVTKMAGFIHDPTLTGNATTIRLNGNVELTNDTNANAIGHSTVSSRVGYVGDDSSSSDDNAGIFYDGDIAEIVYYTGKDITSIDTDIVKIESYLALKYGITIPSNYVNSDDATIWDATANAAYHNNVIGLIKDDGSLLEQRQTRSVEENSILTVSMSGSIVTTNEEIENDGTAATFVADEQNFLIIGNDGNGSSITIEDAGNESGTCLVSDKKINRDWKVEASTNMESKDLTLSFDVSDLPDPNNYNLIIDDDGNFDSGIISTNTGGVLTGNELVFTGVNLASGNIFTLYSKEQTGLIIYGNGVWFGGSGTDNALSASDTGFSVQILEDVTLPTNASCECINIASGTAVTVPTGQYLQLTNEIELLGDLYLEGTAELIQVNEPSAGNINLGSGSIYKILGEATDSGYRYNYLSSPVNNSTDNSMTGTYSLTGNLKINTGATLADNTDITFISNDSDGFGTTISSNWLYTLNSTGTYTKINENTALSPGVGFTMKGSNQANNYNFIGSPNNGNITAITGFGSDDFAILGNPYPSAIDAELFNAAMVAGNITDGVVYFWDQPTGDTHIQDSFDGGYATYTGTTGVAAAGVTSATEPTKVIKPGQGFVISGGTTGGDVTFTNSMRIENASSSSEHFFRTSSKTASLKSIIRLGFEYETNNGIFHRQLAITPNGGSLGYDLGKDAPMFDNYSNDAYLLVEDKEDKYVITEVPYISEDLELPIGIVIDLDKEVTFKIDVAENVSGLIYLLDKENATITNLKGNDVYKTVVPSGIEEDRFSLVFGEVDNLDNDVIEKTKTFIYTENKIMTVVLDEGDINELGIYDLLGKKVQNQVNETSSGNIKLDVSNLPSQIYVVKIRTNSKIITKKIVIK